MPHARPRLIWALQLLDLTLRIIRHAIALTGCG